MKRLKTIILMYEIKTEDIFKDCSQDREMLGFRNYSPKPKYYDYSNKLVVGQMKNETAVDVIEEFVGCIRFWQMMVLSMKSKGCEKNVVATISHGK